MLLGVSAVDTTQPRESLWVDGPVPSPVSAAPARTRRRRPVRRRPVVVDVLAAAAGLGLGITIGLAVLARSSGPLQAPGGGAAAAGRPARLGAPHAMGVVALPVPRR